MKKAYFMGVANEFPLKYLLKSLAMRAKNTTFAETFKNLYYNDSKTNHRGRQGHSGN
jgi:hypothetical protein